VKGQPPQPYSIGIESIARKAQSYSGGRVWAEPIKADFEMSLFLCKKIR